MPSSPDSWYVYMVRCRDNTIYTGIAKDLAKRLAEHNSADRGAKYTRGRRPVVLIYHEEVSCRSAAAQRENRIKRLPRSGKESLAATPSRLR